MEVIRTITGNAAADKLWKILGEEYDKVGEWTSQVLQALIQIWISVKDKSV